MQKVGRKNILPVLCILNAGILSNKSNPGSGMPGNYVNNYNQTKFLNTNYVNIDENITRLQIETFLH